MTKINTNSASLLARAYGQKAHSKMLKPMERLSSGLRINSASDDAAGLAVTNKMTANIKDYDLSAKNGADMINLLQTAETSLAEISRIQTRLMELAVQSANGTYTQIDRDAMELELYGLVAEIDRIANNTTYNKVQLLDGTYNQSGQGSRDLIPVNIGEFGTKTVGRHWEGDDFENNNFSVTGPITAISATEHRFPGWAVHNKRVRLGQGTTPGSTTIGGYPAPIDPTPNPHQNVTGSGAVGLDDEGPIGGGAALGTAAQRGFSFDATGGIKLSTGGLTSDPFGIVHGPYLISQEAKQIHQGDVVKFDWKSDGTSDAGSVFAYLLDETTGDTIILHDYTQNAPGATAWATKSTNITRSGNYKFVFINGTYDATGGTVLGADFYVNNIIIERNQLPADQQHLVSQISVKSVLEAQNATNVLQYSLEQTAFTRATLGATINRYESAVDAAGMRGQDMRAARSRVRDAEYYIETTNLAKQQILANASMAMLAQANSSKKLILALIQ